MIKTRMEGNNGISNSCGSAGPGNSGDGKPPNPLAGGHRQSSIAAALVPCSKRSMVRHPSLMKGRPLDVTDEPKLPIDDPETRFVPALRSGAWTDIGSRSIMEDVCVCADNFLQDYRFGIPTEGPNAFYGVFDGHGGKHAADFACSHLPQFIADDEDFPMEIERAISSAFQQTDTALAQPRFLDADIASGTTALAALVVGSSLVVANAGDCRAVLSRRGKAIEMSRDHKPLCSLERKRIEASGGYVNDGYLNGQLNVARALGDWHLEGMKSRDGGPLTADPEFMSTELTEEDEFLVMGCDGIWDVFTSQNAVDFSRRRLQEHNDPEMCCRELVDEALKRRSGDNLSVVVVCFQKRPPPNLVAPRGRVHRSISAEGLKELQGFLDNLQV